ncbi:MAG: hypothetical protein MK116_07800 [Phycisphaerales bacterium]|nr:hypothetical protein [Phycisphaerales bacterium]
MAAPGGTAFHGSARFAWPGLLIALAIAGSACSKGPPPAAPSTYVFTSAQASSTMEVLKQTAEASPRDPVVPLDLLPKDGIRWETLEDAVNHAVGVPELEMAVTESKSISDTETMFYLVDPHMWPASVTVRRIDEPPYVAVTAVMGPWPADPFSQEKAWVIRESVLASIMQYGKIRVLPGYTPPVRAVSSGQD